MALWRNCRNGRFRVTRPGGYVLLLDPDQTCTTIDADDVELATFLRELCVYGLANPASGRRLRSQMIVAGFDDVAIHPTRRS
jgi:hypothetical protein